MGEEEVLLLSTSAFRLLQAIEATVNEPLSCAALPDWRVCGSGTVRTTIYLPVSFYSVLVVPRLQLTEHRKELLQRRSWLRYLGTLRYLGPRDS